MIFIMELVLKSLSAREVRLANTSVLQLGRIWFFGWLVVLCEVFWYPLQGQKCYMDTHIQTQSREKKW